MQEQAASVGPDGLATLKLLALEGGLSGTTVTCSGLADRLDASNQTASRRLQRLEDAGLIDREILGDGQRVRVTDEGERSLRREYEQYRRIFEEGEGVTLRGTVTSGMGEGRHYISLPGYMRQFEDELGYEPFLGTMNLELDAESVEARAGMDALDPVRIDGWEDEDRTYGPAFCWPAVVERESRSDSERASSAERSSAGRSSGRRPREDGEREDERSESSNGGAGDARERSDPRADDESYDTAHVIAPERTHHGADQLELIAPDKLRDVLSIDDGDELTTYVEK